MKAIIAVVVTTTLALTMPALAQSKSKQDRDRAERGAATVSRNARAPTRRARSANPQWDVYRDNGEYAGTDPDPHVRAMLRRDDPNADP
jgi:hypothetical protein